MEQEFEGKLMDLLNYTEQTNTQSFKNWVMRRSDSLTACAQELKKVVHNLIEERTGLDGNDEDPSEKDFEISKIQTQQSTKFADSQIERIQSLFRLVEILLNDPVALSLEDQLKDVTRRYQIETRLPLSNREDNQFAVEVVSTLTFEQNIVLEQMRSAVILERSLALFQRLDLSPEIVHSDLSGQRALPRLLLVAYNMVESAVEAAKNSNDLVQVVQGAWKSLSSHVRKRMEQTTSVTSIACACNEIPSFAVELGEIQNTIGKWARKNIAKALNLANDERSTQSFRVVQLSKSWWEDDKMSVDALIQDDRIDEGKERHVSFQFDRQGRIVGFNLYEPIRG